VLLVLFGKLRKLCFSGLLAALFVIFSTPEVYMTISSIFNTNTVYGSFLIGFTASITANSAPAL
jgi:hypothetical protein